MAIANKVSKAGKVCGVLAIISVMFAQFGDDLKISKQGAEINYWRCRRLPT